MSTEGSLEAEGRVAEFIGPIVEKVREILRARMPAALGARAPFVEIGKSWTGVNVNPPSAWVMPVRTDFDGDVEGYLAGRHIITIKMGLTGAEPDLVTDEALVYMAAMDAALVASWPADWAGTLEHGSVLRVWVGSHDYGPLFNLGNVIARFPEMDLVIETAEEQ